MFADKKSITQWQEEFLDKGDSGEYLCPIDKTPVEAVRKKGQLITYASLYLLSKYFL